MKFTKQEETLSVQPKKLPVGLLYVPYKIITTKAIISDENGTREYWQIGRWMRFKLWCYKQYARIAQW